ncbi:MAG: hypothetical protein ACKOAF_03225 [Actinomycetes bacterium]
MAYVLLPVITYIRVRSVSWLTIATVFSVSAVGVLVSLGDDLGHHWTRVELQWSLLVALVLVLGFGFRRGRARLAPINRQLLAVGLPLAGLLIGLVVITTLWTAEPAFLHPVSFLMGHANAEDNAKWLDFTSQLATGNPIVQAVAMGGPLELFLVFVATAMGVISQAVLGGYNEVAIAANTVIYGEFLLVCLAPLALAPLAEAIFRGRDGSRQTLRIPIPFIWLGMLVLTAAVLLVIGYGHMTFQFTMLIMALWATTFLAQTRVKRARLLTSLIIAGAMTVWLPLNVLAVVILAGWLVLLISRPIRFGASALDLPALILWAVFAVSLFTPIKSSLIYLTSTATSAAGGGGGSGLVSAAVTIKQHVLAGLDGSGVLASNGGTEQTQPILAILAAVAVIAAAYFLSSQSRARKTSLYRRFMPLILIASFAAIIYVLDIWSTGAGPHYGSLKFTFLISVVTLATCVPIGLLVLDPGAKGRMSGVRWLAVGAIVYLAFIDSFLPRAISRARPEQWSPAIPFSNPQSYWWPADVNGTGHQPISANPVGCVYLPQGAKVPSGILVSQLSDAQRVYSCTRLLAGLSGQDAQAQPVVDWLRREWLNNKSEWEGVHGYLEGLDDSVKNKQMIILDDGSNVIGLETLGNLVARYPATAGQ